MDFMHALSFDKELRHELDTEVSAKCLWKDSTIATVSFCSTWLKVNLLGGDSRHPRAGGATLIPSFLWYTLFHGVPCSGPAAYPSHAEGPCAP